MRLDRRRLDVTANLLLFSIAQLTDDQLFEGKPRTRAGGVRKASRDASTKVNYPIADSQPDALPVGLTFTFHRQK